MSGRFLGPSVFAGSPRPRLVGDAASSDEVMVLKAVRRDCPPFPSDGRALTTDGYNRGWRVNIFVICSPWVRQFRRNFKLFIRLTLLYTLLPL